MSRAKKVKFKRNDRVYVRASNMRCTGIVKCIRGSGEINGVKSYDVRVRVLDIKDLAGKSPFFWFPEHVCKLLKPKKPKPARVWIIRDRYWVSDGKKKFKDATEFMAANHTEAKVALGIINRLERKIARLEGR